MSKRSVHIKEVENGFVITTDICSDATTPRTFVAESLQSLMNVLFWEMNEPQPVTPRPGWQSSGPEAPSMD